MTDYQLICGAEIHVELKTASKMFCGCKNDPFGAPEPNIYTCPVCLGMPGGLPVPNRQAIEDTILLGLALHSEIPAGAHFDRKHYFYPDLPKGYQISQKDEPFCIGGYVDTSMGRVRINHIHLEEDAAKMHHAVVDGRKVSLIDYNRSSVPLVEIVTEPDIRSPEQAKEFLKNVRDIVRSLGISDCDMEKGSMRLEANISLSSDGSLPDYKVEVKNINSFRFFANAMESERKRQTGILNKGDKPVQETRGYRDATKSTASQRGKEGAADYRYMPDPDLPPLLISREWVATIRDRLPELPKDKIAGLVKQGVSENAAAILVANPVLMTYYADTLALPEAGKVKDLPKSVANDLANKKIDVVSLPPADYLKGKLSRVSDKITDEQVLRPLIEKIITGNPTVVAEYKAGKVSVIAFFIGQLMKESGGKADPQTASAVLKKLLS